jgi:ssDNA-binding Zn-finger/Zn-ribbon topoisomerase 1
MSIISMIQYSTEYRNKKIHSSGRVKFVVCGKIRYNVCVMQVCTFRRMIMSGINLKWNAIELVCGRCKKMMEITSGQWGLFYTCTGFPECNNKMNTDVYDLIIDEISKKMTDLPDTNLTGYVWTMKKGRQSYTMKIARHQPTKVTVTVINKQSRPPH